MIASLGTLLVSALLLAADPADATQGRQLDFTVYLDDREIGFHRFRLRNQGLERELESEACFKVKIPSFNAYRYAHDIRETWRTQCLRQIESRIDDTCALYALRARSRCGISRTTTGSRSTR